MVGQWLPPEGNRDDEELEKACSAIFQFFNHKEVAV
jgi:hypothetical protein